MSYSINKSIPLPLYYQLKNIIIHFINDGVYMENTKIPTEQEFINEYDLSRTTVRQALNELVNEGYLYKKKGVGTFVSAPSRRDKVTDSHPTVYRMDRVINRNGYVDSKRFLGVTLTKAIQEVATNLEVEEGEPVWCMDRLQYADNKPVSFSRTYFCKKFIEDFDQDAQEAAQHFYRYLDDKGFVISIIRERLRPDYIDNNMRDILNMKDENLVMIIENRGYLEDGTAFEYTISVVNTSTIEMYATFKR